MATPCIITLNGKDYTPAEFMDMLVRDSKMDEVIGYKGEAIGGKEKIDNQNKQDENNNLDASGNIRKEPANQEELVQVEKEIGGAEKDVAEQDEAAGIRTGKIPIADIEVRPDVFQFKEADESSGVNKNEKLEGDFDKNLAGTIAVWTDRAGELGEKGKTYVVDGHHRMEFAKRNGVKDMEVFQIEAPTAKEAKIAGAKMNIAQGRGTSIDAAKIYRDASPEQLKGFEPKSKTGREGKELAKLDEPIFNLVVQGKLDIPTAMAIAKVEKGKQEPFYRAIKRIEDSGAIKMTPKGLAVMAEKINEGGVAVNKVKEVDLFGTSEKDELLLAEQSQLESDIKEDLSRDAKILGNANKNKEVLENAKNVVNVEENAKIAEQSKLASGLYDTFKKGKAISDIIKTATEDLGNAKGKKERAEIREKAIKDVKDAINTELEASFGKKQKGEVVEKAESPIGKTITFNFAGRETKGVVKSIDGKGNYKVVEKDGTKHTVKPEDAQVKEPTAVEKAEQEFKDALKDLGDAADITKLGVMSAPGEKAAEAMYRVHKALVKLAKEYIAKGVADVKDFAKKVGVSAKNAQQAWDEAIGAIKHTKDTIEYDMADIAKTAIRRGINVREKFAAYKEKAKDISEAITKFMEDKELRGSLSAREISSLVKRAANVKTDKQLDKFIDYAEKVINDANYIEEMDGVRDMQAASRKRNHVSFGKVVKEFTSINPESLPEELVLPYKMALDGLMARVPSYKAMTEIFYDVVQHGAKEDTYSNVKTFAEAQEKYAEIGLNKVQSIEDYRKLFGDINAFRKRVDELAERGDITEQERTDLLDQIGKDQEAVNKKYASEITSIKTDLINEVNAKKKDIKDDQLSEEDKKLLERFLKLDNDELRNLSPEEIYNLSTIIDNLKEEGRVDVMRLSGIVNKAESVAESKVLAEQIGKGKPFLEKFNDIKSAVGKLAQEYSSFWESKLGLGSVGYGAMQKYVTAPIERALGSYRRDVQAGFKFFNEAKKKYGIKNDEQLNKIGMVATYLREYGMGLEPENKGKKDNAGNEFGTRDWFEHIINNEDAKAALGKEQVADMKKLWDSLPKKNGKVDVAEVFDSFEKNDGKYLSKNEMSFLKDVMDWRDKNTTGKQRFANEVRGKAFDEVLFHIKRIRKGETAFQSATPIEVTEGKNGGLRIAAGSGKQVVNKELGAVETNFERIFTETLEENMRDYHVTPMLQKVSSVMKGAREQVSEDKAAYVDAIKSNAAEAINNEFGGIQMSKLGKVATSIMRAKAAQVLITPTRTVVELVSALASYPARAKAFGAYGELFKKRDTVSKLMEQTESPYLSRVDLSRQFDVEKGSIKGEGYLQKTSELFAALPERLGIEPVWMAVFGKEFKAQTGKDFNRGEYLGNPEYAKQFRKQIKDAGAVADATYGQIAGATTRAGQRRNIKILPDKVSKAFGLPENVEANSTGGRMAAFMTGYPYREVETVMKAGKAMNEALKSAEYSKGDVAEAMLPALGVMVSALAYNYGSNINYLVNRMITGDDEDAAKAKKQLEELHTSKALSMEAGATLVQTLGSRYSGLSRSAMAMLGSLVYNISSDKETKASASTITRNITFQNPIEIKMKKDGTVSGFKLYSDITGLLSQSLPPFSTLADNTAKAIQSVGGMKYLYNKVEKGEILTEPEKDALISAYVLVNMGNEISQLYGVALPSTTLNRVANNVMKERKEGGAPKPVKPKEPKNVDAGNKFF